MAGIKPQSTRNTNSLFGTVIREEEQAQVQSGGWMEKDGPPGSSGSISLQLRCDLDADVFVLFCGVFVALRPIHNAFVWQRVDFVGEVFVA